MNAPIAAAETPSTARPRALAAVSVLLVVAFVAAVVGAIMWARAATGDAPGASRASAATGSASAAERGRFLAAAEQAALNLTTVNPNDTDAMMVNILSSSTGGLAAELDDPAVREQLAKDIKDRGVTQISRVAAISPSGFDPEKSEGRALVFIVQEMTSPDGQTALRRQGMSLDMRLVDGDWKVDTMEQLFQGIGASPGGQDQQPGSSGRAQPTEPRPAPSAENPAGS